MHGYIDDDRSNPSIITKFGKLVFIGRVISFNIRVLLQLQDEIIMHIDVDRDSVFDKLRIDIRRASFTQNLQFSHLVPKQKNQVRLSDVL